MSGRSKYAVQLKRYALRISPCWEGKRRWTHREDGLLGTMRDSEASRRLGRSISCVRAQRLKKTKVRFIRSPKRWTPSQLRMLRRFPDAVIARRTKRFLASVRNKRVQLGIPSYA